MASYLTCTVAQAREFNATSPHHFVSLNQLLDERANSYSDVVVAGFPELNAPKDSWNVVEFSMSSSAFSFYLVSWKVLYHSLLFSQRES